MPKIPQLSHRVWSALLISISAGFLLFGYESVRSPANTIFKANYGSDALAYASAVMPVGIALIVYIYTKLLKKLGPKLTLLYTSFGSALLITFLQIIIELGYKPASAALLLVREVYVVLIIEQYWSFLDSTLNHDEAKVWNGPICGIASILSTLGGFFVARYAGLMGTNNLLLVGAASIFPAIILSNLAFVWSGEPQDDSLLKTKSVSQTPSSSPEQSLKTKLQSGLYEILRHKRLQLIFFSVFLSQSAGAMLDLAFQTELQNALPDKDAQTAFSGAFFGFLNFASLVAQFLIAPLLVRKLSGIAILCFLPVIYLLPSLFAWIQPSLYVVGGVLFIMKTCDYSIFRVAKELVFGPLSFTARYRSKEIIDVFGYRASKGISSGALLAAKHGAGMSSLGLVHYMGAGSVILLVWSLVSIVYFRIFQKSNLSFEESSNHQT